MSDLEIANDPSLSALITPLSKAKLLVKVQFTQLNLDWNCIWIAPPTGDALESNTVFVT